MGVHAPKNEQPRFEISVYKVVSSTVTMAFGSLCCIDYSNIETLIS